MKIERAVREKTYTLTSIAGPSGSGKTYSAILYARGLVGPEGKIGFIDTENKRSRFYADVAGGFDVIDLDPPFSSQRYTEAIRAFETAGYTAIIIDSISHEWEGTGGVLEQAEAIEQATKRAGLHCWAKPKGGHKKLMNELLQTRAHLIFCCRVKEKVVQVKGANGKAEIVNEGFVVVQEKMFIYEMTVSMMLAEGNHVPNILKCPGDLLFAFPDGKKITSDVGAAVRQWSDQGVEVDTALDAQRRAGLLAANGGTESLKGWWSGLGAWQKRLEGMKDTFKSIATAADQLKSDIDDAGGVSPADRLAAAKAASGDATGEGFDLDHVTRNLQEAITKQEKSAPPPADERSAEDPSPLAAQETGVETADGQSVSPVSELSDEDRDWLKLVAKMLWAATGVGEQDVLKSQFAAIKADLTPATISKPARDRGMAILSKCKLVCFGEAAAADTLDQIAMSACCEKKEIVS